MTGSIYNVNACGRRRFMRRLRAGSVGLTAPPYEPLLLLKAKLKALQ